jgi:hypothetical protein
MLDSRKRATFDAIVWSLSLAFAAAFPALASAGAHRYGNDHAAYRAECGTCHIAYPPALLGAEDWRGVMNGLERHFGTDASIANATRAELAAYLEAGAGRRRSAADGRISQSSWFRKEHREVAAATWSSTAVKSAANCEACHRRAADGDFDERSLHVPGEGRR